MNIVQNSLHIRGVLRLPQVIALYVGAVLGSGILILPGLASELAGPASLLAWAVMGLLVVPMALTIGFLSARYPDTGGVASFLTRAFNPKIGSLFGWFFLFSVVAGAPVLALTGAGYICLAAGLGDIFRLVIAVAILSSRIILNYIGMKITGQVQMVVVLTTIIVIIVTIIGSFASIDPSNFFPFIPNGWEGVGHASAVIFWCFIGWEAISHISVEFTDPERDAIRGTIIAAVIISSLYFFTACIVVGTHSYGPALTDVSLMHVITLSFGKSGAIVAGLAALFICTAPAIAYIVAASRLASSLAIHGFAPQFLARRSRLFNTPLGGLLFLSGCFTVLLLLFSSRLVSLSTLIQIPSGSFILTYMGGSAAGIILLKDSRVGVMISSVSLILTSSIFLFIGWAIMYPLIITVFWSIFIISCRFRADQYSDQLIKCPGR